MVIDQVSYNSFAKQITSAMESAVIALIASFTYDMVNAWKNEIEVKNGRVSSPWLVVESWYRMYLKVIKADR